MVKALFRFLVCAFLFYLPQVQAEETLSISGLRHNIEVFKKSEDSHFAPSTIKRSEAYLGAAMLADDQHNADGVISALERAGETLEEAKYTSRSFQQQYEKLLALRKDASAVVQVYSAAAHPERSPSFQHLIDSGENALNTSIQNMEAGQLNQSQQYVDKARGFYSQAMEKTIPWLSEEAAAAVAKAAAGGAKQYAPVTYEAAKKKVGELRNFITGRTTVMPQNPIEALYLAHAAKVMTQQVKQWRRKTGSHENVALKEKKFRQQLAKILGLEVHENALLVDISNSEIEQAVTALRKELVEERKAGERNLARLKKYYEAELQNKLNLMQEELLAAKNTQMTDMKDAFRTKLEKETFETKRQKAVHALFKAGEASILANLDGSLIIRLSNLQFASGRSKIDSRNFDLLGRLKQALDIYSDRNVRIEGHTDSRGEVKLNQKLSLKRAEAVRDFLIAAGTDGGRLKALGYGEVRPIASNEFKKGRAMNRRIDIAIGAAK